MLALKWKVNAQFVNAGFNCCLIFDIDLYCLQFLRIIYHTMSTVITCTYVVHINSVVIFHYIEDLFVWEYFL